LVGLAAEKNGISTMIFAIATTSLLGLAGLSGDVAYRQYSQVMPQNVAETVASAGNSGLVLSNANVLRVVYSSLSRVTPYYTGCTKNNFKKQTISATLPNNGAEKISCGKPGVPKLTTVPA